MSTRRSYGDACGIARALDAVGERWALLVVRELLFGPRRFSDLRGALAGASSNMLVDRLRELEARGVVQRRRLLPPAGAQVYELTARGRALEPVLLALGAWGLGVPLPRPRAKITAASVLLFLRTRAGIAAAAPATYRLEFPEGVWTIRTGGGELEVAPGEPVASDAGLRTDPVTLSALLAAPRTFAAALRAGTLAVTGDRVAVVRLLRARGSTAGPRT